MKLLIGLIIIPTFLYSQKNITIDLNESYQTIEYFTASDCWTVDGVAKSWPSRQVENAARMLFSTQDNIYGNPEGIGLSMWRVNLGAGTAELGDVEGNLPNLTRRCESFMDKNGIYDWSKQAGQQKFMEKAVSYGCNNFTLFSNSPLVQFTKNGQGYSPGDRCANLQNDKYDDFAEYLATVTDYFIKEKGFNISYISPVNEPQHWWNESKQEGSPWTNAEIKRLVVDLDKSMISRNLNNTKILISEAGSWSNAFRPSTNSWSEWARDQIFQFFDINSSNYIGDCKNVARTFAAHSYWTDRTNDLIVSERQGAYEKANKYGLTLQQTEWCMLTSPPADGLPNPDMTNTDIALFMSKLIYADLSIANSTTWGFWTAMDGGGTCRYKLLNMAVKQNSTTGIIEPCKTLWALGNYSLFIRPGYKRIKLDGASDLSSLMGSAYISPDTSKVVAVYVNIGFENQSVKTQFKGIGNRKIKNQKMFKTDSSSDLLNMRLQPQFDSNSYINIPKRSVITFLYDLENDLTETSIKDVEINNKFSVTITNNSLIIDSYYSDIFEVKLFNMLGSEVLSKEIKIDDNQSEINLPENITTGFYMISLNSMQGNRLFSKKINIKNN